MRPEKKARYDEFYADGGTLPNELPIHERCLERISFEASELLLRLEPTIERLEAEENAAFERGEEYSPTLRERVTIGVADLLDGVAFGNFPG